MCGIVAVWNRNGRPIDVTALRRSVQSLARRGPDGEGYLLVDTRGGRAVEATADTLGTLSEQRFDLALGHRRLAIVDLSPAGHQPMGSKDGKVWLVFNGMIYNFEELRARLVACGRSFRGRSDTEVLLESYLEWGPRCVDELNGMWAFVVWDARTRTLLASRDRLGVKPLVYHLTGDTAAFASEMKALAPLVPGTAELDPQALHHYLSLMQVPAPFTIDRRMRKLLPARMIEVGREGVRESRYWSADAVAAAGRGPLDDRDAERKLEELLADSVRKELVADVPAGTLLSGGVDSSLVSALAAEAKRPERLTTFSVTFPGLPDVDESMFARRVAEQLGSEHVEIELRLDDVGLVSEMVRLYDEPFAVSSVLGVYLLAKAASSRVKILLSGDGGDELFAGYERYLDVDDRWRHRATRPWMRLDKDRVAGIGQWVRWQPLKLPALARLALESLGTTDADGIDREFNHGRIMFNDVEKLVLYSDAWRDGRRLDETIPWLRAASSASSTRSGIDPVLRRQLMELHTSLPDEMLAKVDRATMAWGIEARVPILDHRVAEHALSLSPTLRYGGHEGKSVLKRIAAKHVPREVVYRTKRGFTIPIAEWLRGGLREFVRDTLSPAAVRRAGVFDPKAVADVIAWYEREPTFHTAHMVYILLGFHIWQELRAA